MTPARTAWIVVPATVVVGAVLQAATAVPGLGTASTTMLVGDTVVSVVALVLEIALLAWAADALVRREASRRPGGPLLLWSLLVVALTALVAIVLGAAVVLVLVVALCVLPAAAAGERNALRGFRVFRRTPVRAVVASLVAMLVAGVTWVVALASGLFLTGALGGLAMWVWFGVVGFLLLLWWTRLAARCAEPRAADVAPDLPAATV